MLFVRTYLPTANSESVPEPISDNCCVIMTTRAYGLWPQRRIYDVLVQKTWEVYGCQLHISNMQWYLSIAHWHWGALLTQVLVQRSLLTWQSVTHEVNITFRQCHSLQNHFGYVEVWTTALSIPLVFFPAGEVRAGKTTSVFIFLPLLLIHELSSLCAEGIPAVRLRGS